jgi:MinD-like ATPase involved in chromosome partitioning or flagellar assembly
VEHAAKIGTYGQMRGFTGVTHQDLEVLPGGFSLNDEGMKAEDLAAIDEVLERFYNCLLFDMGTDLRGELASTILERCDAVVLVTNTRKRSIDLAAQTIDYLRTQGHERLLERMVVAITVERPKPAIDPEEIRAGFSRQLRPVHIIPFDPHLAEDGVIDVRLLAPKTALAFEEIAASVTEGFSASHIRWEA